MSAMRNHSDKLIFFKLLLYIIDFMFYLFGHMFLQCGNKHLYRRLLDGIAPELFLNTAI